MKRKGTIILAFLLTAVLMFSAVNVFAETTENTTDDNDKGVSYGRFIMNRMGKWRGNEEEIDLEKVKEMKAERFNSMLSNLVEQGIITEDKANIILEEHEEFINSLESRIGERSLICDQLVEEGILTEEEGNALKETLAEVKPNIPRARMFNKDNREEAFKEALSQLVDEGILTQDKVDKVNSFIEDIIAERQELRYNGGFWQYLVDNDIITEEELEQIGQNCNINPAPKFNLKRGFRNRGQ